MKKNCSRQGFTVIEMMATLGLFTLMSLMLFHIMNKSLDTWRRVESERDAHTQLQKAEAVLSQIEEGKRGLINRQWVGAGNGDAVWFLSSRDLTTGDPVEDGDGLLTWQTNVLYYLIRPNGHAALADGINCTVDGVTAQGDTHCPHKVLIRKVIDSQPNAAVNEPLLTDVSTYLTAPTGYDVSTMADVGNPEVVEARIMAVRMLWFRVTPGTPFVQVDLAATRIDEARRKMSIGSINLLTQPYTTMHQAGVLMKGP